MTFSNPAYAYQTIAVRARSTPRSVTLYARGPQGAKGEQGEVGPRGPAGTTAGFGTVDYSDLDAVTFNPDGSIASGTPLSLVAGTWTQIVRNLTPSAANFNLPAGPWAGFQFWDGSRLRARAKGDMLLFKFTYRVQSSLRGSVLRFAVRPGNDPAFDFGPQPIVLGADAGAQELGSETFDEQCRSRFVTMGAQVYVMSSSGGTLLEFSPEVTPLSHAP